MCKLVVLICVLSAVFTDGYLTVKTDGGDILGGFHQNSIVNVSYFAFKGIPYAQPPLGDLRFRAPLPPLPWTGVRNATIHGATCVNMPQELPTESEDCLFLNVYTTNITDIKKPVMFWIHGGAFFSGSGNTKFYGPGYFLLEDVVVVTINYRLGAFGFLSTGDKYAQGNAGLKDTIMALKWVQRNIERFGGDPENVLIFGQSSGSASVHYLIASPLAEGLFAKAILQSGSMLSPWAWQPDPLAQAKTLADSLNITYTTSAELVAGLRKIDPIDITNHSHMGPIMGAITFAPTVDQPDSEEEIFISQTPYVILSSGSFNKIPIMMGFTDAEALQYVVPGVLGQTDIDNINENGYLLIPHYWNIERDSAAQNDIVQVFRDAYFEGQEISMENRYNFSQFVTDQQHTFPADLVARFHDDVFFYTFSMNGSLNLLKILNGITEYPGAAHTDDLYYLWDVSEMHKVELLEGDSAILVRERMVRLFTNFAKYSNPTPKTDELIDSIWSPISGNQEYMDLNEEMTPGNHTFESQIKLWQKVFDNHAKPLK